MLNKRFRIFFFCLLGSVLIFTNLYAKTTAHDPSLEPDFKIIKGVIKGGSTASSLLNAYIPLKTIYYINHKAKDIYPLSRIRKGQPYRIMVQADQLIEFEYEIDTDNRLVIQKEENDYTASIQPIYYDVNLENISATIQYSLNSAIRKVGEKSELACKLADIFAWDIDFIRDIQPGDSFHILVEKKYKEGKLRGYGNIQAAFFTNNGTEYKAFLYTDADGNSGYYDEQGNSLQKAFLKAPLAFARISSRFTTKRLHPILHTVRPHWGVDYAAPIGTPVKTVGDGVVLAAGYNKGAGNYVKIRHPNGYTTSYFHLSKFAKGIRCNKKVVQGQVIGYVGQTGYATGPHVCFRLIKNGRHIDPLNYKAPSASPVKPEEMDQFLARATALSQRIVSGTKVAFFKPAN